MNARMDEKVLIDLIVAFSVSFRVMFGVMMILVPDKVMCSYYNGLRRKMRT